jgi:protein involved in ribonucleotide reduction
MSPRANTLALITPGNISFEIANLVLLKNTIGNSSATPIAYRETKRNDREVPSSIAIFAELGTNAKHIDEIITSITPEYFGEKYCIA